MERFEEVFKAAIQSMHEVNVKAYGSLMANVMLPGLEALKPVFKATYDQGVKDEQEKLEGCVVVPEKANEKLIHLFGFWMDFSKCDPEAMYERIIADAVEAARGGNHE